MVNAPNFVNPNTDTEEEDTLGKIFIHHSNPEEQERLAEMMRNPRSSIRIKVDTEKLKDQLIGKLIMPVFAPRK